MQTVYVDVNDLLTTQVQEYIPSTFLGYGGYQRQRPPFTMFTINEMLLDPRIIFGLWLIKGPMLTKGKFSCISDNGEVQQFVESQLRKFWLNGAVQTLKAIEWGYSGSEILYKQDEKTGRIMYDGLKDFESCNVRVVTKNGCRTGLLIDKFMTVNMGVGKAVYLGGPKALHHIHWRQFHPYYGRSRLIGVHVPWNEVWSEGGYRDVRRLWFYKNAFEGGTIYHPQGFVRLPNGQLKAYQNIAQEIIEKKRTGGVMALPSETDARGNKKWEYDPAKGNTIPAGLFDYGNSLRIEILEAMGIPYEVIESSGNEGFGSSSGRAVPETAFYSILQEELQWLVHDFVEQCVRPLVQINANLGYLPYDTFEVEVHPLLTDNAANPAQQQQQPQGKPLNKLGASGVSEDMASAEETTPIKDNEGGYFEKGRDELTETGKNKKRFSVAG